MLRSTSLNMRLLRDHDVNMMLSALLRPKVNSVACTQYVRPVDMSGWSDWLVTVLAV